VAENLLDALGHFCCSLIGESDGENGIWGDAALVDEIRDAMRDDARLARARASENQHGTVYCFNACPLLGIQFFKEMLQRGPSIGESTSF
jgi:hypothetical protein